MIPMRIVELQADVFVHAAGMNPPVVAHGVNTQGVMGKGVAANVRAYWPELYTQYAQACQNGLLAPGGFLAYPTRTGGWVYNLASQDKPGKHARIEWIIEAVEAMARHAASLGIKRIAMVRIGSGIGGLAWEDVKAALLEAEGDITLDICSLD